MLLASFARDVLESARTEPQAEDGFVTHALDTLRKMRAAAVDAKLSEIDELLAEDDDLARSFRSLFPTVMPASAGQTSRQQSVPQKPTAHPNSNTRKETANVAERKIRLARKRLTRVAV